MKTICIDARLWGIGDTGPGRYTQNLIDNLPLDPDIRLVLIVSPKNFLQAKLQKYHLIMAKHHPYSLLAQLEMLKLLSRLKPDLLHSPHFTIPIFWWGKIIVTIHDLIKHYSRGAATTTHQPFLYWFKYLGYRFSVWLAVHRARHIITPSNYWRLDLINRYHLPPSKVTVTYEAASAVFFHPPPHPSFKLPTAPYVVHTGNLYPHKNIGVLISAINLLQGRVHLVLVCARSVFSRQILSSPYVHFIGQVTDPDLASIYRHSLCYVFPSLIEGFGLPGLEAMAAGTPVIAANSSCLPEIYGPAALYFPPRDPEILAEKIKSVLNQPLLRRNYITKGHTQVKKYSWVKMAHQTWQIYQNALH